MKLLLNNSKLCQAKYNTMFPSPCGDLVMKLKQHEQLVTAICSVSVPLRGFGYETGSMLAFSVAVSVCIEVSVPLRGFGYETFCREPT